MEFLSQKGIVFEARDVRTDFAARKELLELGSQSTPTIVIGDQLMVGFRPDRLMEMLQG
jgi:glutaredoxin